MLNKRLIAIVVAAAILMVAALFIGTGTVKSAPVQGGTDLSDYALRHPGAGVQLVFPGKEMDDRALANIAIDGRFPGKEKDDVVASRGEASDWFQRHPEALSAAPGPDLSDYFIRHPNVTNLSTLQTDDYALRHPESLKPGNAAGSSTWFTPAYQGYTP